MITEVIELVPQALSYAEHINLGIPACDGSVMLGHAKDTFVSISDEFRSWNTNSKQPHRRATMTHVYVVERSGTFQGILKPLGKKFSELSFTGHQIKKFVDLHRKTLLIHSCITLFPFLVGDRHYIVVVRKNHYLQKEDRLAIDILHYTNPRSIMIDRKILMILRV